MADLGSFDATTVEPQAAFTPLPAGKYLAAIVESEWKRTRAGNGRYLQLTLRLTEGPHRGRYLWARLNLESPSEVAVRLARSELSSICHATGVVAPGDSSALHHIPILITVGLKRRDDTGELDNVVRSYAPAPKTSAAATPSAVTPEDEVPPWL
jgi:hypothetical protein